VVKIEVQNECDRLDKYLTTQLDMSRALISKMIDEDYILVNGVCSKASYKVKVGDVIEVDEDYVEVTDLVATNIPLNITYEDNDIIVINKQSGLTVHPGGGNVTETLVNALLYHNKTLSNIDEARPGIVHRLDKDTSGLMLVAKNNKSHSILTEDFKNKRVKREYTALLTGVFPHESATIDAPIGRDINNRKKMEVTANNSKNAITNLRVIERYKEYTLVNLILETGRTHQIRVHANYIGYPVYNDPIYNTKSSTEFGQYLHSSTIEFEHPITKEKMHFDAPVPVIFQEKLDGLKVMLEQEL